MNRPSDHTPTSEAEPSTPLWEETAWELRTQRGWSASRIAGHLDIPPDRVHEAIHNRLHDLAQSMESHPEYKITELYAFSEYVLSTILDELGALSSAKSPSPSKPPSRSRAHNSPAKPNACAPARDNGRNAAIRLRVTALKTLELMKQLLNWHLQNARILRDLQLAKDNPPQSAAGSADGRSVLSAEELRRELENALFAATTQHDDPGAQPR